MCSFFPPFAHVSRIFIIGKKMQPRPRSAAAISPRPPLLNFCNNTKTTEADHERSMAMLLQVEEFPLPLQQCNVGREKLEK